MLLGDLYTGDVLLTVISTSGSLICLLSYNMDLVLHLILILYPSDREVYKVWEVYDLYIPINKIYDLVKGKFISYYIRVIYQSITK